MAAMTLRLQINLIVGALTLLFTAAVIALQLSALREDLSEVLERYRRVGAGNPSAKRVAVYVCPLPVDRPPE